MTPLDEVPFEEELRASGPLRRAAVLGAKVTVALLLVGTMVGGIGLLHLRAQNEEEAKTVPPLPVAVTEVRMEQGYDLNQRYAGRLEPRRSTDLAFERDGLLTAVLVEEGDSLAMGQVVAVLDIEPLEARRAELEAQRAALVSRLELARITTKRQQQLSRQGNSSKQRYDEARLEAQALEAELGSIDASIRQLDIEIEKSTLTAPYAGRVASRDSDEGAIVSSGTPVVTLMEASVMEARIGLSPNAASSLRVGANYTLEVDQRPVQGELVALRPDMATGTRTVSALFRLSSQETFFLGELAILNVPREVRQDGIWLPLTALVAAPKGLWNVYTLIQDDDGGKFVGQEAVFVHHVAGEFAYVSGSLKPGALVINAGPHRVAPGQRVAPQVSPPMTPPATDNPVIEVEPVGSLLSELPQLELPATAASGSHR